MIGRTLVEQGDSTDGLRDRTFPTKCFKTSALKTKKCQLNNRNEVVEMGGSVTELVALWSGGRVNSGEWSGGRVNSSSWSVFVAILRGGAMRCSTFG